MRESKKTATPSLALLAAVSFIAPVFSQGRDSLLNTHQEEWSQRIQLAAQAVAEPATKLSYQRMAEAFNSAPEMASLDIFAGDWLLVAEALPGTGPGRYSWSGLRQRKGWTGRIITPKPPFQNENGLALSRGNFGADLSAFEASSVPMDLISDGKRGGFKRFSGYSWSHTMQGCGDCDTSYEWEPAVTFEFRRVTHDNADYVIEKKTVGDDYKPPTGKGGGTPAFYGYRRLRAAPGQ